jgi:hypothetical protein
VAVAACRVGRHRLLDLGQVAGGECQLGRGQRLGQQLLVLTPADPEARERLELLRVVGVEEFPTAPYGTRP